MIIPINKEIIKNTHFFKKNGKFYMCYEIPEDDFEVDQKFIKDILELNGL